MEAKGGGGEVEGTQAPPQWWGDKYTVAVQELWACKFRAATDRLGPDQAIHPVPACLYAQTAWLQALLSEHPEDIRVATERIEKAQKLCATVQSKKYKKEQMTAGTSAEDIAVGQVWAALCSAETTLFDSILKFKMQKHVKGAYNFRNAWKGFEEAGRLLKSQVAPEHPDYPRLTGSYDFGVGLFHFMISVVPREFLWLVEAIGFKGNRQLALNEIRAASEAQGIRQLEAKLMMVALKVFFFEEVEEGTQLLTDLVKQEEDSVMILYTAGWVQRMRGDLASAARDFSRSLELCTECPQLRLYILFEQGCLHYISLDWPSAARYFVQFLEESRSVGVRSLCHYQLGVCQAMMFHEDTALEHMQEVSKYVRKGYTHDEFADRAAKKYIAKPFTNAQRKLLIARLHFEGKQFSDGLNAVSQAEAVAETEEDEAVAAYLRAECHKGLKQYDEAETYFKDIVEGKKKAKDETYLVPFSQVGLAEIETLRGNYNEARALFRQAKKHRHYDYENWVSWYFVLVCVGLRCVVN
eukprot:TRINITY_DN3003_c1_g1_i1.p1 TRINITY_DN3003_c1_g1~~TRINITY_DN3003_c1_g1_i1.p1  ORF type:complete len:544 (+),score=105.50 TRINITY_DN3003_c1_g1_i1:60-1634(+)